MRALTPGELLDVWESGMSRPATERALLLLAAMRPDTTWRALAELSIGQRDAALLKLRDGLWGSRMLAITPCPACKERLEIALDTSQLLTQTQPERDGVLRFSSEGYEMRVRLPNSQDAIDASAQGGLEAWQTVMLERCILAANHGETAVQASDLPVEVVAELDLYLAKADPLADIQLELICPSCAHRWQSTFDIASFLWTELEAWAWRMLADVHTLAAAYGWAERDIVNLGAARRQFYLEMVGA